MTSIESPSINTTTNDLQIESNGSENEDEHSHFEKILNVFRYYKKFHLKRLKIEALNLIPDEHRQLLLASFPNHLADVKQCILNNQRILSQIVAGIGEIFENRDHNCDVEWSQLRPASEFNMDKLRSTLRQIVRDWTNEGLSERESSNRIVVNAILDRFPNQSDRHNTKILVPGAGLGRLVWDLANLGFTAQGNEFSLFMLFVSNFILNKCDQKEQFILYPWIHQTCNNWSYEDQLRSVRFPDVSPFELPKKRLNIFSMCAGDFVEVFASNQNDWDCIATVFFLDTAPNILHYLRTIHRILKPGAIWVNFGPLLYHFADTNVAESIELPYSEVRRLIEVCGFRIDEEKLSIPCTYTQNVRSMLQYEYKCAFFVCTKL